MVEVNTVDLLWKVTGQERWEVVPEGTVRGMLVMDVTPSSGVPQEEAVAVRVDAAASVRRCDPDGLGVGWIKVMVLALDERVFPAVSVPRGWVSEWLEVFGSRVEMDWVHPTVKKTKSVWGLDGSTGVVGDGNGWRGHVGDMTEGWKAGREVRLIVCVLFFMDGCCKGTLDVLASLWKVEA